MSTQDKTPQLPMPDAFTGEEFTPRSRNHYEENDGKPHAPPVQFRRPSVRERVENLLNRGTDVMAYYVGTEGLEMEIPDDEDAELTTSEANYLDALSAQLAEAAPLPDDGLPGSPLPQTSPTPAPEAVAGVPAAPAPASAPAPSGTVPSR